MENESRNPDWTEVEHIFTIELPKPRIRSSEDFAYYRNSVINAFNYSLGLNYI